MMFKHVRPALAALVTMTALTGILYPLSVTALAQLAFDEQANGSLVRDESGRVRGSWLLAQPVEGAQWFHPRPSVVDYATVASGASNLAPSNPVLFEQVRRNAEAWAGTREKPVPLELVTTSGSGLDPHLSLEAALFQVERIAAARGVPSQRLVALVRAHAQSPWIGPTVVNVLALNLALAENPAPDFAERN
ncbi:potassium-transporting ATPase subunit KdpC [Stutzerimonas marianensis]